AHDRVLHGVLMNAFDILGDPVRRRILELLVEGEHASGEVVEVISREFGITQSAVSQQLKVLRERGFATVRAAGTRRVSLVRPAPGGSRAGGPGGRGWRPSRLKSRVGNVRDEGAVEPGPAVRRTQGSDS